MHPAMNCAMNPASYSSSFLLRNVASTSRWRPNTLTNEWPVNASSICALSAPVCRHWATNRPCERLVIALIVKIDSGTVITAMHASSGEMMNIITVTPTIVRTDVSIWLSDCCRLWAMLSMSLVTRLSRSPRGSPSMYFSGRRLSLSSTSLRRRRMVRWTTPARRNDCPQANTAEARYRQITRMIVFRSAVNGIGWLVDHRVEDQVGGVPEQLADRAR